MDEGLGKALGALTKQALVPLAFVFQAFLKASLAMRKEALKDCDLESASWGSVEVYTVFSGLLR